MQYIGKKNSRSIISNYYIHIHGVLRYVLCEVMFVCYMYMWYIAM